LPILAFLGLLMGIYMVHRGNKQPPVPPIAFMPPKAPYISFIAASGIIEAASENVPIGVPNGQIVEKVFVQVGDFCKSKDPLFQLDTRVFNAQVEQAKASVETYKAQLHKLIVQPRPEEVPPLEFEMLAQEAMWQKAKAHLGIYLDVKNPDAISKNDYQNALWDERSTYNSYKEAEANLALKLAGAWIEDINIASQSLAESEAALEVALAELDQTMVRAPFDGQVLQLKLYPGSYAQSFYNIPYYQDAMLIYGCVNPLHIRISIDEEDAWRFIPKSGATAFIRGNGQLFTRLNYVKTEPYVIPKRSLTGDHREQTDTRVLQVIYSFDKGQLPVYVGQLMDIYIEAPSNPL